MILDIFAITKASLRMNSIDINMIGLIARRYDY